MADSARLPGSHYWPGLPTPFWQWFRQVDAAITSGDSTAVDLAAIEARVTELESQGSSVGTLTGARSVQVLGTLADGATVQLRGDQDDPGETYYYGTNADGTKGWYSHAVSTLADVDLTGLVADDVLRWNGTAWVRQAVSDDAALLLADADVPRLGTVNTWALAQTFTVAPIFTDAAGTLTNLGVSAFAQTLLDDESEQEARETMGATNVGANLFTAPDPSAVTFIRINADNTPSFLDAAAFVTAIGAEPAISAGTTAQFRRGDETWSDTLTGDLFLNTTMRIGLGPGGAATNVVFGASALAARTTATGQIAIGGSALAANQSQNNNIAIGNNSMAALTTGTGNTAVGASTLSSSASVGGGNCAFGGSSLAACASSSNVGFGQQTLEVYSATGTGANCAFGDLAGRLQTSGTRNVYVGRRSGVTATSANANVSGSNNTYVGTDTGPGSTTQLSYATALGSEAVATTSNTVVLGRTTDTTVIGATGDNGGAALLQVTGGTDLNGAVTVNDSGADVDFRVEGDSLTHLLFLDASAATENIALLAGAAPNWQSMDGGLFIANGTTIPSGNPSGGGFLYVEAGALKWRGSAGTITTLGAA